MYDYMYGRSVITNGYYNSNCFSQMGISKHDNSEFKAYILLLQCFESWAYYHPSGRHGADSEFLRAFGELCEKNTEFPPSFFLKSFDCEQMPAKRDLKRENLFLNFLNCANLIFLSSLYLSLRTYVFCVCFSLRRTYL